MGFLVLTLSLLMTAPAERPRPDCSPESIEQLESLIRSVNGQFVLLEARLDSLQTVMSARSTEILEAQGHANNIRARRKLSRLLKDSRDLADHMNAENTRRRDLREQRGDAANRLSECYSMLLNESLQALAGAVRRREVALAETLLDNVQLFENKARDIASLQQTVVRPGLSEEFIAAAPRSELDREFLLDTLRDLHEKAVRDSSDTLSRLESERATLQLKQELRDLLGEAGMTGMDGRGFFENLGSSDIDLEIVELERRVRGLEDALSALQAATIYYQDTIRALSRAEVQ